MTKPKAPTPTTAPFAYEGLDRVIHERARLSILTSLITHRNGLSFVELKELCALTDGNLARHLQVLEENGMVRPSKDTEAGRGLTTLRITPAGRKRYLDYLTILEQVVRDAAAADDEADEPALRRKLTPINT
ncbi:transcriptional regulator, ArsR family [Bryocella elongata]|uniref:Transcriptional regulator, ArsR family n=1 Tax=Bryocella elongata TaxID=863522 RepID=A0A1H5XPC9_9BACT|nr:transcriptional regulator [Bryocella elongata]SEG13552.1 transcriptional regulator, ArsR family [Bryocella elongata]